MMRKAKILVLIFFLFCISVTGQSIHSLTINDVNGGAIHLSQYQGKKVLVIIATTSKYDTARIMDVAAFHQRYGDTIKIIGILSREDGYADSNKAGIQSLYQSRGVSIVLTEPMYTRKAAGSNQSGLMQWLTSSGMNKKFDGDVDAEGFKFFVDENGKLMETLISPLSLLSSAATRLVKRKTTF
jgi:glutathione peroxidase